MTPIANSLPPQGNVSGISHSRKPLSRHTAASPTSLQWRSPIRYLVVVVMIVTASLMASDRVLAQYASGMGAEGIAVMGVGQIALEPQKLELSMRVQAQGTDAKSAAKALVAHQERVRKDLVAMNADAESIRFSSPKFESGESQEKQQAMRMMRRQMGGASTAGLANAPAVVTAMSSLRVQWALPKIEPEALAILPQGLKEQIISRDLAGKNNQPEMDEETREQLSEMEAMMEESFGSFSFGGESDRLQPRIVFVATADTEQRQEAMKQAMAKARQSAELIAAAADVELGRLKSLAASDQQLERIQVMRYSYGESDESSFTDDDANKITSTTLDGLKLSVTLMAVYEL